MSWSWSSEAEYHAFYTDETRYHVAHQMESGLLPTRERDEEHKAAARVRLALYEAMGLGPARLLDVGAGGGAFVDAAQERGWEAFGLEPCAELAQWAWDRERNVRAGRIESHGPVKKPFSVITLHDTLEHPTRPVDVLRSCMDLLTPDGALIVEMPEFLCPFGGWERHIRPEQHVCLYSRESAERLFRYCGFAVEAVTRPKRATLGKISFVLRKQD